MRSLSRRIRANIHYLRRPTRDFLPILLGLVLFVVVGGACFKAYYRQEELGFAEALYLTYCLIFMEHLKEFPEHWLLQIFYFVLPPLGLVVVLDGIVRFSYHILRRDESGPEWVYAMAKTMNNHVILFGLGKLGVRVLQQLLKLGELVVVVEKDPLCPNIVYAHKHGVPVRVGTGREEGVLEDLNLANAKSVILATGDDLANLEVAIDARRIKSDVRVVLRMFDQELAQKIKDTMDLHLAFSTWELAAPLFATASFDRTIENSFYVGDELMVVARMIVRPSSTLIGRTVGDMRNDEKTIVLDHRRDGAAAFIPDSEMVLEEGDEITVQARASSLKALHEANYDSAY